MPRPAADVAIRDTIVAMLEDEDSALPIRCEWCHAPLHEGEARLRFFAIVFHLGCWDASVEALRVPRRRE
jgi:hypothetical protein